MRILITGAAGFIGSNLCHHLAAERPAWKLTALDLLTYAGNLENLKSLLGDPNFDFVKADICDRDSIAKIFSDGDYDCVFHLAAESHVDRSIFSATEFVRTNVLGTQTLVEAAREFRVKRFVHVSTDEVYGSLGPTGSFVETTPLDPTSPYSASKAASDLIALAFHKTHKLDVIVTRCTNNYGPYQFPEKFIPLFISNALEGKSLPLYGDGMNVRSWIHVNDHCQALLMLAERGRAGEVYNIGGGARSELPNREVARQILAILEKPESLIQRVADRPAHDRRYAVDAAKIKSEVGWETGIEFGSGLKETIGWYRNNRHWWEKIKSGEYRNYYERNYGRREGLGGR